MRQYSCAKVIQTQNVSTKKLCAKLLYEKGVRKMLVKLTPGQLTHAVRDLGLELATLLPELTQT